jgi:hypothetical protein
VRPLYPVPLVVAAVVLGIVVAVLLELPTGGPGAGAVVVAVDETPLCAEPGVAEPGVTEPEDSVVDGADSEDGGVEDSGTVVVEVPTGGGVYGSVTDDPAAGAGVAAAGTSGLRLVLAT